jgi:hypothetical protein
MKNTLYIIILVCLAIVPAYAQNAPSQNNNASDETASILLHDYADRVNGLLRDVHANLQQISERMESGSLTAQQEQQLKLDATRAMIARLETLSAVYDHKIPSVTRSCERCALEFGVPNDETMQVMRSRLTVNVRDLESIATRTAGQ